MDRGFHGFGFEGCGGLDVLSLRRDGTYTVSPSDSDLVAFSRRGERFGDGVVLRSPALHLVERLSEAVGPKPSTKVIEKTRLRRKQARIRNMNPCQGPRRRRDANKNETAR